MVKRLINHWGKLQKVELKGKFSNFKLLRSGNLPSYRNSAYSNKEKQIAKHIREKFSEGFNCSEVIIRHSRKKIMKRR